jgi:hypothetical protein
MTRQMLVQESAWGPVRWKKSTWGPVEKMTPEHDDLVRIAVQNAMSLPDLEQRLREDTSWMTMQEKVREI